MGSEPKKSDTKAEHAAKSSRTEMGPYNQAIKVHTRARLNRNGPKGVSTVSQYLNISITNDIQSQTTK